MSVVAIALPSTPTTTAAVVPVRSVHHHDQAVLVATVPTTPHRVQAVVAVQAALTTHHHVRAVLVTAV